MTTKGQKAQKTFELTDEVIPHPRGKGVLVRIRAIQDIYHASAGDLGGFVEGLHNIEYEGWVGGNAKVWGQALIGGYALVDGNATVGPGCIISGYAHVYGNATLLREVTITDYVQIFDKAYIHYGARIKGNIIICENAIIKSRVEMFGDYKICGNATVYSDVHLRDGHIYRTGPQGKRISQESFKKTEKGKTPNKGYDYFKTISLDKLLNEL